LIVRSVRAAAAGLVLAVAGCTTPALDLAPHAAEPADVALAVVTRADITSVLTVDAAVRATPAYAVLAEVDGVVRHHPPLKPTTDLVAGEVVARQGEVMLTAPVDSFYVRAQVPDGVFVHAGTPIAVLRYAGFGATATVPPSAAYRLYEGATSARLQVTGGPGVTDCQPLPVAPAADPLEPQADPPAGGTSGAQMTVLCAVPAGSNLIDGSTGVLGLTTAERSQVLTLPAQAVAGADGHGRVVRRVDGGWVVTDVTIGVTDGVRVEIVDGLDEADEVWPYGPDLRPTLPGRQ
jgi:membrane fusion protein, macrolide-specific efflux system